MTSDLRTCNRLLLVSLLWCGACKSTAKDKDVPPPDPYTAPSIEQAQPAEEAPSAPPAPPPPKADPVDGANLKTGLATMLPRITAQIEAFGKITPTEQSRFFMHPDEAKS